VVLAGGYALLRRTLPSGCTALHVACQEGRHDAAEALAEASGPPLLAAASAGGRYTRLHYGGGGVRPPRPELRGSWAAGGAQAQGGQGGRPPRACRRPRPLAPGGQAVCRPATGPSRSCSGQRRSSRPARGGAIARPGPVQRLSPGPRRSSKQVSLLLCGGFIGTSSALPKFGPNPLVLPLRPPRPSAGTAAPDLIAKQDFPDFPV
jgi:hypothetical protein